jgi:DNA-binding GntR family transcriptional regulator
MAAKDAKKPSEYDVLREMIVKGKILPNERLVEADYALLLGTNRANIRRAFSRLEQEGLIVSEPFRGARVHRLTPAEAIELFEVRGALEVLIVQHAVERVTDADQLILEGLRRKVAEALAKKDPMLVGTTSRLLREELWRISAHSTAVRIVSSMNSRLVRIWYRSILMPGRAEAVLAEMNDLVQAIADRSSTKAVRAMTRYHAAAVATLKKALDKAESFDT